jgi:hypothetical protein
MVFCYIFWTFGIVRGNLVYFSRFGFLYQEKIWQPWSLRQDSKLSVSKQNRMNVFRKGRADCMYTDKQTSGEINKWSLPMDILRGKRVNECKMSPRICAVNEPFLNLGMVVE